MQIKIAYGAHILTATGAVPALLAFSAAADKDWSLMFIWLLVAFVIDGIDGPIARRVDVKQSAPHIDGTLLDLMIDYVVYILIPAYALWHSGLVSALVGFVLAALIVFASVLYMANTGMKSRDNSFVGFPAAWNMVLLAFFAVEPPQLVVVAVVVVLTVAMFLPIKFLHPIRTPQWRVTNILMMAVWMFTTTWAVWVDFYAAAWVDWLLGLSTAYLLTAGAAQQWFFSTKKAAT